VFDLQVTQDNTRIVTGSSNKTVYLWDVLSARVVNKYEGHAAPIRSVALSPAGDLVFSGSEDATLRIWDLRSRNGKPIQILSQFKDSVTSIKISGEEIVTGAFDGVIRTFDVRQGSVSCDNMKEPIQKLALSHRHARTVSCHTDSILRLTDRTTGELLNTYSGRHTSVEYPVDVCLTCDDRFAICGSEDGLVVAYDMQQGVASVGRGHSTVVTAVDSHPTSPGVFISGSFDSSLKVWRLQS